MTSKILFTVTAFVLAACGGIVDPTPGDPEPAPTEAAPPAVVPDLPPAPKAMPVVRCNVDGTVYEACTGGDPSGQIVTWYANPDRTGAIEGECNADWPTITHDPSGCTRGTSCTVTLDGPPFLDGVCE